MQSGQRSEIGIERSRNSDMKPTSDREIVAGGDAGSGFPQVAWYKELKRGHWRVLVASFLGWIFDGYENYALFLIAAPALRQLLPPDQLKQVSIYQGIIVASMLIGVGSGG